MFFPQGFSYVLMLVVMTYNLGELDPHVTPLKISVNNLVLADLRPGCDRAARIVFGPFDAVSV
jgi:hypothetical protein